MDTKIATAVMRKRTKQVLDLYLVAGIEAIIASYIPQCCCCGGMKKPILLVCGLCNRMYCDDCWVDCNDENFHWKMNAAGMYSTDDAGCDNCN